MWECPLPLYVLYLVRDCSLTLCGNILYLCEDCNLCGNVLYLCAVMSSISVRDCSHLCAEYPLPRNILYLGEGLSSVWECLLPLCGNVLYLCAGLFSIFVREYPLPR
ncbi:hypothetical protein CDAR_246841 [Caerostris darwini]|uniref:Uncharacterized protein n=1 Tax=Caerostris darwini TaxID=1538125 RepID=A0AAV4QR12_9ARAC|nr:hypothetical protein CDAR_246841 [Caerostris darwini]